MTTKQQRMALERAAFLAQLNVQRAPLGEQGAVTQLQRAMADSAEAQLSDTAPPREPPQVPAVDRVLRPHRVSAWRNGGGMHNHVVASLEAARAYAETLAFSHAQFFKLAIVQLVPWETIVETRRIEAPEVVS